MADNHWKLLLQHENSLPDELPPALDCVQHTTSITVCQPFQPSQQQQCVQQPCSIRYPNNSTMSMQMGQDARVQEQHDQQGTLTSQHHHLLPQVDKENDEIPSVHGTNGNATSGSAPSKDVTNIEVSNAGFALQMISTIPQQQQQSGNNMPNQDSMRVIQMKSPVINATEMGQNIRNGPQSMTGNVGPTSIMSNVRSDQQQQQPTICDQMTSTIPSPGIPLLAIEQQQQGPNGSPHSFSGCEYPTGASVTYKSGTLIPTATAGSQKRKLDPKELMYRASKKEREECTTGLAGFSNIRNLSKIPSNPDDSMVSVESLQLSQVTAVPAQDSKEWHTYLEPYFRDFLTRMLLFSDILLAQYSRNKTIGDIVAHARQVESQVYETSNSSFVYHQLMSMHIDKPQHELHREDDDNQNGHQTKQIQQQELQQQHQECDMCWIQDEQPGRKIRQKQSQQPKIVEEEMDTQPKDGSNFAFESTAPTAAIMDQEPSCISLSAVAADNIGLRVEPTGEQAASSVLTLAPSTTFGAINCPAKKPHRIAYSPGEVKQILKRTLRRITKEFRIPDDSDTVKKIGEKLDSDQYKDPWEYVDDVRLMFKNAKISNPNTRFQESRYCSFSLVFEWEINLEMQSLGYCCGRKYTYYTPQVLSCYGKQFCTIPLDSEYFSYNRYSYCIKCFNKLPGGTVSIEDNSTQLPIIISKEQFTKLKNDGLEPEPFVECKGCGRKQHQICVLHVDSIWPDGFNCDNCLQEKGVARKENKYRASCLPTNALSTFVEERVKNFLREKEVEAGEVFIRVVASSDKVTEVKPEMKKQFVDSGDMAGSFPYREKALLAFQEIDGNDVCFFGVRVLEYGSNAPAPNTRRVYMSYVDSVHFFRPKNYRTAVYHEILLGYFDYVKQLGFWMAHIWACPPSDGDDYIFNCHPPDQKIPTQEGLQKWYETMLIRAKTEGIVIEYKNIHEQAMEDNLTSAAELPYFEGDFWPNAYEEIIRKVDEEEKRRQAEKLKAATNDTEVGPDGKKKGQKKAKKSTKAKARNKKNKKKSNTPKTGNDLSSKVIATVKKHKDVFFVVRLHSAEDAASLSPVDDPDPLVPCDLMDGRDAFLEWARNGRYEFSSLRRTKFSSMALLYNLHCGGTDRFVYTCNKCKCQADTRYHCTVCNDFDLCSPCYEKDGHIHEMEKIAVQVQEEGTRGQQATQCVGKVMGMTNSMSLQPQPGMAATNPPVLMPPLQMQTDLAGGSRHRDRQLLPMNPDPNVGNPKAVEQPQQQPVRQAQAMNAQNAAAGASVRVEADSEQRSSSDQQQQDAILVGGAQAGGAQTPAPQPLDHLMQTLKSPTCTPQQQQQAVQILRNNPVLLAAFIEHLSPILQQQQQSLSQSQPDQQMMNLESNLQQQIPIAVGGARTDGAHGSVSQSFPYY